VNLTTLLVNQKKVWDADNLIGGRARYQEQIRDGSGAGSPAGMLVDPRDFFAFEKSCEGPPACHPDDTDVWVPECEGVAAKRMMDLHRGTGAWIEWGTTGTCGEGFYLRGKGKEATGEEQDKGEERLAVARELARAMSGEGKGKEEAGSLFQKLFRGKRGDKVGGVRLHLPDFSYSRGKNPSRMRLFLSNVFGRAAMSLLDPPMGADDDVFRCLGTCFPDSRT
jgi:hypothetical protein